MNTLQSFDDVVLQANELRLYAKLVEQLNKDLTLANINLEFHADVLPTSLKLMLHEKIFELVQNRFMDYLNLLYIVDVAEEKIRELDGNDILQMSAQVAFLILKREWQKVYFKNQYSS
ncbi:hypothetical protein ES711_06385 [Gelidibacter salicanalis]|uniref:Uncharacterized protein n=1 Tax=Gelidibacter salicanalis TaxID=291193 RepID=A0A5C7AHE6_9FLAO|nr:hypothetical protein [Gelidibacter salicanalis]TXE08140.1 hypothetical protein ES711_06385 [Gelidibacter salicanalis]